jgi:citrate synthase
MRQPKTLRSDLAWSNTDRIVVRGLDLPTEIIGKLNLGDMAFLEIMGRIPTPQESVMFNALAVTLVEHGLVPSTLAARITYLGAPEAMQAAVAAGLCGLGSVFVGSTEGAAAMLREAIPDRANPGDPEALAADIVARFRAAKKIIPGMGHPIHRNGDPRTPRLFQLAAENGFSGPYVALVQAVARHAEAASGRKLPINATGAIGAIACELDLPQPVVRGIGVMARAVGLVGHLLEESRQPISREVWERVEDEATEHVRPAE